MPHCGLCQSERTAHWHYEILKIMTKKIDNYFKKLKFNYQRKDCAVSGMIRFLINKNTTSTKDRGSG